MLFFDIFFLNFHRYIFENRFSKVSKNLLIFEIKVCKVCISRWDRYVLVGEDFGVNGKNTVTFLLKQ